MLAWAFAPTSLLVGRLETEVFVPKCDIIIFPVFPLQAAKKSKALRKCISALREAAEYMSVDDIDEKTNSLKVIISENGSTSTEST